MAAHPLQRRLQSLRNRVVRLLLVRGLSTMVVSVVALAIGLGSIDYVVRFRDRGVLVIFAACLLGVFAWTVCRLVRRFQRLRLSDTDLALRIETSFPAVRDRLASAVEFLHQSEDDAAAGSAAMRRAAIAQVEAQCDAIDFAGAVNCRPAFRAALASLAICVLVAGLVVLDPAAARTALFRLAIPLGKEAWPQKTHLALKEPVHLVARGQPLEIEVVDAHGARLPAECRIHYRFRDAQDKLREESEPMRPLGPAMIARRENLTRSLEFRVTGGDDQSMPWMPVDVLDPPAVASLELTVIPPSYTNWPRQTRDATTSLPILAGSRVELVGAASKPLRSALLNTDSGRDLAASLDSDGLRFHVGMPSQDLPDGLVLDKSSAYTFQLVDRDGICGGAQSWQFRVQTDAPPTVLLQRPRGDLFATPAAHIDLRIEAGDDLGLRQVALLYSASGATAVGETALSLYEGPPQLGASAAAVEETGPSGAPVSGARRIIEQRWEIEALKLLPGTRLTISAAATDYRPQTVRSEPRTLTIITPDDLQERLIARQGRVLAELARWLQLQREVRAQTGALQNRLHETAGLDRSQVDRLQTAEFNEREIVRGISDQGDGVSALVSSILADLEANRLDNPEFARRMQGLLDEFERLQRKHFAAIVDELTAAVKGAQSRLQSPPPLADRDADDEAHLLGAGEHQQRVIESLEDALSHLRQWDDYRRFQRDVAQLVRDQEAVAQGAAELGRQTLGRDAKELSPQEIADLKTLVQRQFELARRQNRIEQEMEQTAALLRVDEPLASDVLSDAVAEARRLAIASAMLGVAGRMRDNGLGQAPADHKEILQGLHAVLDILSDNRSQDTQRLARELSDAARDLTGLRKRQEGLRRKLDALADATGASERPSESKTAESQHLGRQQEAIRQETLQMARRLERLTVEEPARSATAAAEKMAQASREGTGGAAPSASRQAREAEKLLADAAAKLQDKRNELAVQLAVEQQARLGDAIKHLHRQETQIERETQEFAALERAGPLTRAQVFSLLELARQQALLREEMQPLAALLAEASAFRLGLSAADEEMRRAADLLQDKQTGSATQQAEQAALDRLALLLGAMELESNDQAPPNGSGNGNPGKPGGANANSPSRGMLLLAEIKFLKLWQEDLNRRTRQLEMDAANRPAEEIRERQARLADEQARLAAATLRLRKPQDSEADTNQEETNDKKENGNETEK